MINEFLKKKVSKAISGDFITEDYKNCVLKKAEALSSIGVSDEVSLRKFHHIAQLVPIFVRRATNIHDNTLFSAVSSYVFDRKDQVNKVEEVQEKVIEALLDLNVIEKKAYPQDVSIHDPIPKFNTQRWIKALNDINMKRRLFRISKESAIISETKGWTDMEINKFRDWVSFYEQGGHLAYKTAQTFTTDSGISVPFNNSNNNIIKMPNIPGLMERQSDDMEAESIQRKFDQKKIDQVEAFKKIRNSVIGRISSAKKLISSEIGRQLVGVEYEKLLTSLLQLEKDILTLKNQKLLADVIARAEAGLLAQGHKNAAYMLTKIAQDNMFNATPPMSGEGSAESNEEVKRAIIETLQEASASTDKELPDNKELRKQVEEERKEKEAKENKAKPAPPNPAPAAPSTPETPEVPAPPKSPGTPPKPPVPTPPGVTANYQWANYKTAEVKRLEVVCESIEKVFESTKAFLKVAQMAPPPKKESLVTKYFEEEALDRAFANIKLNDVVRRLQALSKVFKNREIARQLSIIDLMLDRLGIAGLFPQLAEATKSALESNQYSSIRIEEILSKLTSVMDENGNVGVQIQQQEQEPSLIDKEMEAALMTPDVVSNPQGKPLEAPAPPLPGPAITPPAPPMPKPPIVTPGL